MTIPHDYKGRILIPKTLLKNMDGEAVTRDGVKVRLRFIGTYNNTGNQCSDDLEAIAERLYGCSFRLIAYKWSKMNIDCSWWEFVGMEKI